jgi:hypothetical protein
VPAREYQHALFPVSDEKTLPWIEFMCWIPPVATEFSCMIPGERLRRPWYKKMVTYPTDADGFVHLNYDRPGLGHEPDWEWIEENRELV